MAASQDFSPLHGSAPHADVGATLAKLEDLDLSGLEAFVRDLLLERAPAATAIDQRRQELPYHPLLAAYRASEDGLRERLERVGLSLLQEAAVEAWDLERLHYLLTFIEEAPIRAAMGPLEVFVHSGTWLRQEQGTQRQMLALRTLLGLGWYGEPNFWLEQHQRLGRSYPELIFRALADHGLDLAFSHLSKLVRTPEDARKVLRLFPTLVKRHSLAVVKQLTQRTMAELHPGVGAELERWFCNRDYGPLSEGPPPTAAGVAKDASQEHLLLRELRRLEELPILKLEVLRVARVIQNKLQVAMRRLPPRDRDLVVSYFGLELPLPVESGAPSSPSREPDRKALARARKRLNQTLEDMLRRDYAEAAQKDRALLGDAIKVVSGEDLSTVLALAQIGLE